MSSHQPSSRRPILIAGATASGKSALGVALAERLDGVVINADSMQVYRELRVLTARPSVADEQRVPHVLYGCVPAAVSYSVGRFISDAAAALRDADRNNKVAIFVGGTGLYFKALLDGLSPVPPVPDDVRKRWRQRGDEEGAQNLHDELQRLDPIMAARLERNDRQRIVRALEVREATGRSLASWQSEPGTGVVDATRARCILVKADREVLQARADARVEQMIADGAVDEAARLAALALDPSLPAMRAIGVAPFVAHARGEMTLHDARLAAKLETRQYIKRQETWHRRHMITWKVLSAQEHERIVSDAVSFIQS